MDAGCMLGDGRRHRCIGARDSIGDGFSHTIVVACDRPIRSNGPRVTWRDTRRFGVRAESA
ncbi:hypothetical protein D7S86_00105 [Pararobbsia silviterrae]|uniref:Uncharacterized protein n=1 Tax=Pararobbsia silviterrae TaxID=1792498 RepID=A0A494Y9Q0_9BURK|nr:hypothetical protein D7S86_00105 [Pararobbsia silviterrae]